MNSLMPWDAFWMMVGGGAAGGVFAAIFTQIKFPRPQSADRGLQHFARFLPVVALAIIGAIGGLMVPFLFSVLSGVFGDSTVLDRVLQASTCGEIGDIIRLYKEAYVGETDEFRASSFRSAMATLPLNGRPHMSICTSYHHDLAILFGLSVVAGFSTRALIPKLSESLMSRLNRVEEMSKVNNENLVIVSADAATAKASAKAAEDRSANAETLAITTISVAKNPDLDVAATLEAYGSPELMRYWKEKSET